MRDKNSKDKIVLDEIDKIGVFFKEASASRYVSSKTKKNQNFSGKNWEIRIHESGQKGGLRLFFTQNTTDGNNPEFFAFSPFASSNTRFFCFFRFLVHVWLIWNLEP